MRLFKRCGCKKLLWTRCPHPYYFSFKLRGRKERECTGEAELAAAGRVARERRVDIEKSAPVARHGVLLLSALETIDLERVRNKGCRPEREADIKGLWKHLKAILGADLNVLTLTSQDLESYVGKRRAEGDRGQTIRRERQALKRAVLKAVRDGLIPRSPIEWGGLDNIATDPKNPRQSSKGWREGEIRLILSHLSAKAKTARIVEKMRFIQLTGLRAYELPRYNRDTWLLGNELHIPAVGKNTEPRIIYLGPEALELAQMFQTVKFGKPNKALKRASKEAGFIDRVLTPRDLRAYFISQAAQQNLPAAQKLAGHKNVATTSRYLHLNEEEIKTVSLAVSGGPNLGPKEPSDDENTNHFIRARSSSG